MTTNRLTSSEGGGKYSNCKGDKLTAAEWAAIAREKGHADAAKAWDQRASELGEERIPNGITVRFRKDGSKERVSIVR